MEDLTAALATSFHVTYEPNTTAAQHPRFAEYKKKSDKHSQDERRRRYLDLQKKRRFDCNALVRNLSVGSWDSQHHKISDRDEEDMEYDVVLRKPGRYYKNQLMFSEWLVEVPDDFEKEWTMVICPTGKRSLIVASQNSTSAYAKNGFKMNTFQSLLPGGNRNYRSKMGDCTIMDCILDEANKTYFVLDLMYWKQHPLYESETEFRFYWLSTKFSEHPEIGCFSKLNPYKFLPLPSFPCNKEVIPSALSAAQFPIDGLLFYHKRTHYTFGATPLVVWLKPYMLPEILNIHEPAHLLSQAPAGYSNYAKHMEKEKEKEPYGPYYGRKRKGKRKGKQEGMEVGQSDSADMSLSTVSGDSPNTSINMDHGAAGDLAMEQESSKLEQDCSKPEQDFCTLEQENSNQEQNSSKPDNVNSEGLEQNSEQTEEESMMSTKITRDVS
ncbi:snurportin-1-like [Liolophura sinensis]|uniref:snurportin-1-like n=1 Tax=Liolophura sinensis TaxID=3198878 RepID=UPI00315932AA